MLERQPLQNRQIESEGILRMLLLALALAMPLGSLIYLQAQKSKLGYEMSELRDRLHKEEELQRKLLLERSRFQRDEEIHDYATRTGLQPRKQGHVINRAFNIEDQKVARFRAVSSEEALR